MALLGFRHLMNLFLISVFSGTAALGWWLSGYDVLVTGENRTSDFCRRATRCGMTLLLVGAAFMSSWILVGVIVLLAIIWADCLSELFLRGLQRLTNSEATSELDQKLIEHELDRLAMLVQNGWHDKAIALCMKLRESGEASTLTIETVLFQIYSRMFSGEGVHALPALLEAQRLRAQAKPAEAAFKLESCLGKEPYNLRALFLLIQIYAQDLRRLDKADALLWNLTQQPQMPPAFLEHVRRFIQEWCEVVPRRELTSEGIESLVFCRGDGPGDLTAVAPARAHGWRSGFSTVS
jgi:hypothetical protein